MSQIQGTYEKWYIPYNSNEEWLQYVCKYLLGWWRQDSLFLFFPSQNIEHIFIDLHNERNELPI